MPYILRLHAYMRTHGSCCILQSLHIYSESLYLTLRKASEHLLTYTSWEWEYAKSPIFRDFKHTWEHTALAVFCSPWAYIAIHVSLHDVWRLSTYWHIYHENVLSALYSVTSHKKSEYAKNCKASVISTCKHSHHCTHTWEHKALSISAVPFPVWHREHLRHSEHVHHFTHHTHIRTKGSVYILQFLFIPKTLSIFGSPFSCVTLFLCDPFPVCHRERECRIWKESYARMGWLWLVGSLKT